MDTDGFRRKITAIMSADVVGYSKLMAADEAGTIERQKAHRAALIDPKIAQYGGRIVKTTGDGLLVDFPSVIEAVRCAVDIQNAMRDREAGIDAGTRISATPKTSTMEGTPAAKPSANHARIRTSSRRILLLLLIQP